MADFSAANANIQRIAQLMMNLFLQRHGAMMSQQTIEQQMEGYRDLEEQKAKNNMSYAAEIGKQSALTRRHEVGLENLRHGNAIDEVSARIFADNPGVVGLANEVSFWISRGQPERGRAAAEEFERVAPATASAWLSANNSFLDDDPYWGKLSQEQRLAQAFQSMFNEKTWEAYNKFPLEGYKARTDRASAVNKGRELAHQGYDDETKQLVEERMLLTNAISQLNVGGIPPLYEATRAFAGKKSPDYAPEVYGDAKEQLFRLYGNNVRRQRMSPEQLSWVSKIMNPARIDAEAAERQQNRIATPPPDLPQWEGAERGMPNPKTGQWPSQPRDYNYAVKYYDAVNQVAAEMIRTNQDPRLVLVRTDPNFDVSRQIEGWMYDLAAEYMVQQGGKGMPALTAPHKIRFSMDRRSVKGPGPAPARPKEVN